MQGSVSTVNGRVTLDQVAVTENAESVNGGLELKNCRIGGNVEMVNGRSEVIDGTVVAGDVVIHKTKGGWSWGSKPKPPVLVIGAGSEVRGRIVVENPDAKVFVHESARIGTIEGAQATRYSGTSHSADVGGRVTTAEAGRPCQGSSTASTPPMLPTPAPL